MLKIKPLINNKKFQVFIILTLILTFTINFLIYDTSYATVTGTLGAIYGVAKGTKILAFLYACLAAGVTFKAIDEAETLFDKWQMDTNNWEPPLPYPDKPPGSNNNGWKEFIKKALMGGIIVGAGMDFIDNIKNWFKGLGAKEGENIIQDTIIPGIIIGENVVSFEKVFISGTTDYYLYLNVNGVRSSIVRDSTNKVNRIFSDFPFTIEYQVISKPYDITTLNIYFHVDNLPKWGVVSYDFYKLNDKNITPVEKKDITYNVYPTSYIITNNPPVSLPIPNISNLPQGKIKPITKPDGKQVFQYTGDYYDLVTDIVNTTTEEDVITGGFVSNGTYTIYEIDTETGTIIEVVPEVGDLPFPDLQNPEQPGSELEGQGIIITLLKSIVNWLYNIWRLPQQLFVPKPDYLKLKIDGIRTAIGTKVKNPELTPILGAFQGLT